MKASLLILALGIALCSCGSAWKLKRAESLIRSAIANGAKADSLRTVIHDTIHTSSIQKEIEVQKRVDTVRLIQKCRELIRKPTKKRTEAIQQVVCPDTTVFLADSIDLEIQGKVYKVPVKMVVESSKGVLRAALDVPEKTIPFVSQAVAVGISSGYTLWGLIWRLLVAFIIGFATCFGLKLFRVI